MPGARESFGTERWDDALQGDEDAIGEVSGWLAADGLWLAPIVDRWVRDILKTRGVRVPASRSPAPPVHDDPNDRDAPLRSALRTLLQVRGAFRSVQPSQVAAARVGDLTEDGVWQIRRCGWALDCVVPLGPDELEAWRVAASWGREEDPGPDEPLLCERKTYGAWTARSVRQFALNGVRSSSSNGT